MATKAVMTNANGLARFAALLGALVPDPEADELVPVPAPAPVPDASVDAGPVDVVVAVLVDEDLRVGWTRVVLREIGIPVPPELAAVPIPVPICIKDVELIGATVVVV